MHFRYRETLQWVKASNEEITPLSLEGNTSVNSVSFIGFCESYVCAIAVALIFQLFTVCMLFHETKLVNKTCGIL